MYEIKFLYALAITISVETLVLFCVVRYLNKKDSKTIRPQVIVACSIICSGATLPYVWFVFPRFIQEFIFYVIAAECFAVLAETAIIRFILNFSWVKCLLASFLCNMGSYGAGELIKILRS